MIHNSNNTLEMIIAIAIMVIGIIMGISIENNITSPKMQKYIIAYKTKIIEVMLQSLFDEKLEFTPLDRSILQNCSRRRI